MTEYTDNAALYFVEKGPRVVCCGTEMTELIPNTTDAATETHVPVVTTWTTLWLNISLWFLKQNAT